MATHHCRILTPEQLAAARDTLADFNRRYPPAPLTQADIAAALAHDGPDDYFITTHLFWECDCASQYFRNFEQESCARCGQHRDDQPDARIHELDRAGVSLDYRSSAVLASLDEHNIGRKQMALAA